MFLVCPVGCSELLSSLLKLTEDEEDLALIIPGERAQLYFSQGVTKRCHLSWFTDSALVYEPKCMGKGGGWRRGGGGVSANEYSCTQELK